MVLNAIKNIFVKTKKEEHVTLYINNKIAVKDAKLVLTATVLQVVADDIFEIPIEEIEALNLNDKTLSFVYKHMKHKITAEHDLVEIYEQLLPLMGKYDVIYSQPGNYNIYNTKNGKFELFDEVEVQIVFSKFYFLRLEHDDSIIHYECINSDIQYYMDQRNNTFVWSVLKDGKFNTFSIEFLCKLTFLEFLSKFVSSVYKTVNVENTENEKYFEKMEIENYHYSSTSRHGVDEEYHDMSESSSEYSEEISQESPQKKQQENKNEYLVVDDDKAFVTRGSSVGVFMNTQDGLKFHTNIQNVLDNKVEKMTTHERANSLLILDKHDKDKLHKLDLERGEVVESWDLKTNINDYFDSQKFVNDGTLVAVSDYSVFRIDPRTKEKIAESKVYKTKNEFSCGVASKSGDIAVASSKGDLRLYDKISKRAKSLLPGFGEEIKHIDVTRNGKYVICTCKNYLMLFTVNESYRTPIGKDKPIPKRLQLKPQHLAYINEEVNFTPAKFSTDELEENIITSTGHYVLKWNLRDVLEGRVYDYEIKRYNDRIVADNFGFGENNNIIVTLPDDVKKIGSSSLRKPNKYVWK